jgi:hypothetical protein
MAQRTIYLRVLKSNETGDDGPMVYVDETWIHTCHFVKKCWQSDGVKCVTADTGADQRLVAVPAEGIMGFILGSYFMYDSMSSTSDYHDEIDSDNFKTLLIPGLPGTVVVGHAS